MSSPTYWPLSQLGSPPLARPFSTFSFKNRNGLSIIGLFLVTSLMLYLNSWDSSFLNWHPTIRYPQVSPYSNANQSNPQENARLSKIICLQSLLSSSPYCLSVEYRNLLAANRRLMVLEPAYLKLLHLEASLQYASMTLDQARAVWSDLAWRFSLPLEYPSNGHSFTVGLFAEDVGKLHLDNFTERQRVIGPNGPFNATRVKPTVHHLFYEHTQLPLYLHIVILHRVRNFVWIGAIPAMTQKNLSSSLLLHYGMTEQIFDPFTVDPFEAASLSVPEDIGHFLSQRPTSRYLHCPPERRKWFRANGLKVNKAKTKHSVVGFKSMKRLMRKLKMEFWIACGTLLGWLRQCHITPYTTDTDFDTWAKYLVAVPGTNGSNPRDLASRLLAQAPVEDLRLYQKFGEPTASQEFSLQSDRLGERFDLFFAYPNGTHFLVPFHKPPKYGYSVYPPYELCSVVLLGVKLLAPCDPEVIVSAEYGDNWRRPVKVWDYSTAPKNIPGALIAYNFTEKQHIYY